MFDGDRPICKKIKARKNQENRQKNFPLLDFNFFYHGANMSTNPLQLQQQKEISKLEYLKKTDIRSYIK